MRSAGTPWVIAFVLLVAGFVASVAALNSDLYSAHGFVGEYLAALARKDGAGALAMPGVDHGQSGDRRLLSDAALGPITDITYLSDIPSSSDPHARTVTFSYRLARGLEQSQFTVTPDGLAFGLFTRWRFATSPIAALSIAVLHENSFTVNGRAVSTGRDDGKPEAFLVFTPALYKLDHVSTFLQATGVSQVLTQIGAPSTAVVDVRANPHFNAVATIALKAFLSACARQKVLMPTGCPFGESINNRINDVPSWSIVSYPSAVIEPGFRGGTWVIQNVAAKAHIVVEQKSLYDGSLSTINQDVRFTASYDVTINPDKTLTISAAAN